MITLGEGVQFTGRQRQVVQLIAEGCSNAEIAERLGVSPRTAKAHSDILRSKLQVSKRRQIPFAFKDATGETRLKASSRLPAYATTPARPESHSGDDGTDARASRGRRRAYSSSGALKRASQRVRSGSIGSSLSRTFFSRISSALSRSGSSPLGTNGQNVPRL
jgi:DNA-binding CsgD family transcriptional regulator